MAEDKAKKAAARAAQLEKLTKQWLDAGKPPFTTFFTTRKKADKLTIAQVTFRNHLIAQGHQVGDGPRSAPTATTSKDSHFNDFLNRKVENQEALYLQWLKDERERLLARVQELESQLNPDR